MSSVCTNKKNFLMVSIEYLIFFGYFESFSCTSGDSWWIENCIGQPQILVPLYHFRFNISQPLPEPWRHLPCFGFSKHPGRGLAKEDIVRREVSDKLGQGCCMKCCWQSWQTVNYVNHLHLGKTVGDFSLTFSRSFGRLHLNIVGVFGGNLIYLKYRLIDVDCRMFHWYVW